MARRSTRQGPRSGAQDSPPFAGVAIGLAGSSDTGVTGSRRPAGSDLIALTVPRHTASRCLYNLVAEALAGEEDDHGSDDVAIFGESASVPPFVQTCALPSARRALASRNCLSCQYRGAADQCVFVRKYMISPIAWAPPFFSNCSINRDVDGVAVTAIGMEKQ
jgi:hypothetical protein